MHRAVLFALLFSTPDSLLVSDLAEQLRATAGLPGLSVAAMRQDRVVYARGFGLRDLARGIPVDTATQFGAASVSKLFAATAALRLYQRGAFDLDVPARRYLPSFPDPSDRMTARRLAAHLSGLPHYGLRSMAPSGHFEQARDALRVVARAPRVGATGAQYHYSTHGFTLLSAMMEASVDRPFLDILDTELLEPLDLPNSGALRRERPTAALSTVYERSSAGPRPIRSPRDYSYSWAGAGLRSTPSDLVRLARGYFNGSLHDSVVQMAFTEQSTDQGAPTGIGFAWRVGNDWRGRPIAHHAGVNPGTRAVLLLFRDDSSAIALQTNITWRSSIESTAMVLGEALFHSAALSEPLLLNGAYEGTFAGRPASGTWSIAGDTGSISTPDAFNDLLAADGLRIERLPLRAIRDGVYALVTPWGLYPFRLQRSDHGATGSVSIGSRAWQMASVAPSAPPHVVSCTPAPEAFVDYFASLAFRESPYEDFAGTHRLTAQEAARRNHYRFAYGSDRRLRSVTFALGSTPRTPDHTANVFAESPVIEFCYGPHSEIRRFRDAHGNPMHVRGTVAEERYVLDSLGYRSALTFHDADGAAVESSWGIAGYTWRTERDGAVIEERVTAAGAPAAIRPGFPFYRMRLRFGSHGWLARMENIDAGGALVTNALDAAQDRLEYFVGGEAYAWNVYDAADERSEGNGPRVARGILHYDANGMEDGERYTDRHGGSMTNAYGFTWSRSTFDHFGNMLSRFNHDSAGVLLDNPRTGYAGYRFTWDSTGLRRLRLTYWHADGSPAVHRERGYHQVVQRYDGRGDQVELRYEGIDGRSVNRLDNGVAIIRDRYDARHRLIERRYFDAAGRPVEVAGRRMEEYSYREDGYRR